MQVVEGAPQRLYFLVQTRPNDSRDFLASVDDKVDQNVPSAALKKKGDNN